AVARELFGYGSMLDGMVEAFTENNFAQELWVLPIAEPTGTKATATITFTAAPTASGVLPVYVAGRKVAVSVGATDDTGDVALAVANAINADLSMPVVATTGGTGSPVLTLTAKFKGVGGNDIDVRFAYGGSLAAEQVPVGLAATLPADYKLSGGTGTPDLTAGIAALGDEIYEYVATGYTDSSCLTALNTEYGFSDAGRWGWLRQLYGHVFAAKRGTQSGSDYAGYGSLVTYG